MSEIKLSFVEKIIRSKIQHYDADRYWKYRKLVIENRGGSLFASVLNRFRLLYIKRCDAFNNASLGTHMGFGAAFKTVPNFPHGLYGIIVSHNAVIGANVTIFHQVTIGEGKGGAPVIGDNSFIGAGAKIIGKITIGSNCKIGAGCVVTHDVPDGATVVPEPPQIILKG